MDTILSRIQLFVQTIDERHLRLLYMLIPVLVFLVTNSPSDGPGGVR